MLHGRVRDRVTIRTRVSILVILQHSLFSIHTYRLYRRMMEAEAHGMVHAASNPMAIKRANDSTFEAQIDQARKGLTPRRARKVLRD